MASQPGPTCQGRNPVNTSDGTLANTQSPKPGVQGNRSWLDSAWDTLADDASWASGKARDGALWAGNDARAGAAWVGNEAHAGAVWVGNEARAGAEWTANKTAQVYHYVAGAVDAAWKSRILPMLTRLYHFSQRELLGILCLVQARDEAFKVLDATILEETGYELVSMLGGVIEGLIDAMIQIGVISLIGGVIGGAIGAVLGALAGAPAAGVGAIPGAIAGAAEGGAVGLDIGFDVGVWYVTIIGLKFLVDALVMGFKEMFAALKNYVTWAWAARDLGPALRAAQIKRAGRELARAFGIFMRFVLLALILYVTKKALEFGGGAKGEAEGLEKTTDELGKSGLGPRFARWFKEKFPELKRRVNELKNKGTKRVPEDEAPKAEPEPSKSSAPEKEQEEQKTPEDVIAQRKATARDFYKAQGWSDAKTADHMRGIDFSKPVDVVTLEPGTVVEQWQVPGRPQGNYYAPPGTDPATLGIDPAGRVGQLYEVQQPVQVLRSTAADFDASGSGNVYPGGGTQFFTTQSGSFTPTGGG